jgi:hypothetical protein
LHRGLPMADDDHLRQTLDYYRQLRQQKFDRLREELAPIELMIRQLESDLGESPSGDSTPLAQASNGSMSLAEFPLSGKGPTIRPDEFFTMTQSEAARLYLKKVGHAVSFDELVAALRKGGANLGGADPKRTLYVSLARNPLKEFVWPSEGYIGLSEFYGRTPKAVTPRQRAGKHPPKRRRHKSKPAAGPAKTTDAKKASPDNEAMQELMKDGQPRTAAEIIAALEEKLGRTPDRMAIVGSLNSKKRFEKDGDHYKAVAQ